MMYVTFDDFRQIGVVAKNELKKFMRGRKILLYVLLVGLIVALNLYFLNVSDALIGLILDLGNDTLVLYMYTYSISLLILIGAVLFASYTIVSEYEERTYLLLFTRPIKKTSIFVGKFLACYLITMVMVLIYFGISSVHSLIFAGSVSSAIGYSLLMALIDVFALSGVAMLFSAIVKRGSISALMTFFALTMVPGIIMGLMMFKDPLITGDTEYQLENYWYIISVAESSISAIVATDISLMLPSLSMFLWGMIPLIAAWMIFLKKEI